MVLWYVFVNTKHGKRVRYCCSQKLFGLLLVLIHVWNCWMRIFINSIPISNHPIITHSIKYPTSIYNTNFQLVITTTSARSLGALQITFPAYSWLVHQRRVFNAGSPFISSIVPSRLMFIFRTRPVARCGVCVCPTTGVGNPRRVRIIYVRRVIKNRAMTAHARAVCFVLLLVLFWFWLLHAQRRLYFSLIIRTLRVRSDEKCERASALELCV